jgi:hypothetical protein
VTFPRKRVIDSLPRIVEPGRWKNGRKSSADSLAAAT